MPKHESDNDKFYKEEILNKVPQHIKDAVDRRNKLANDAVEIMKNQFRTPTDLSTMSLEDQASTLTLHFIGFMVKPKGISDELYNKCVKAFSEHRGKCEWEKAAVLGVLKGEKK